MSRFFAFILLAMVATTSQAKLTVHEWGTFTSVMGANGQTQNGMYYEDEKLPDFVHNFGDPPRAQGMGSHHLMTPLLPNIIDGNCPRPSKIGCEFLTGQTITQKMETPVVYFYSDQAQRVTFDVSFPKGIISQSFPAATVSYPHAIPGVALKNGWARYDLEILKNTNLTPPAVEAHNIYGHARNVASDLIRMGSEVEKFIFYRGLGDFNTQLKITSQGDSLRIQNTAADAIPSAFLVYTDAQKGGRILSLGSMAASQDLQLSAKLVSWLKLGAQPFQDFMPEARAQLVAALTQSGLYQDEAVAMVDTWQNGYFKTPGLRVLYVLNRDEVESILPAQIQPQPEDLQRVFVGRIEVLLDSQENHLLQRILKEKMQFNVASLGHMVEPVLLRLQERALEQGLLTPEMRQVFAALLASNS